MCCGPVEAASGCSQWLAHGDCQVELQHASRHHLLPPVFLPSRFCLGRRCKEASTQHSSRCHRIACEHTVGVFSARLLTVLGVWLCACVIAARWSW